MRAFTISAAVAMVATMMLASAPAKADILNGAPERNGNQCFKYSTGNARDARFGLWGACPQTASATVAPAPRRARRHHSSR